MKKLSEHLKYAFLGDNATLPIIISNKLSKSEEDVLLEHSKGLHKQRISEKEVLSWTK